MKPLRYILPLLLLLGSPAHAQRAILVQLPSGQYIGIAYGANGEQIVLTTVQILKMPDPTPPPATATHALLLIETGEQDQAQAAMLRWIRAEPKLSRHVTILDKDTQDENGNPRQEIADAKRLIGAAELPCLIGFADGKPVVFATLPKTTDGVESLIQQWGLK